MLYGNFSFKVTHQHNSSRARLGELQTPHGTLQTPTFSFCATKGSLKSLSPTSIKECNTELVLANTYHLMLSPGADFIQEMGGIHKLMGWDGPMITDSGGFQIFSLGHGSVSSEIKGQRQTKHKSLLKITEKGASFRSYVDGRKVLLTPELAIQIQSKIGADIIMPLDECTPFHVPKTYTESSMHKSHRWELRSLSEFKQIQNNQQALYGIIQGGVYPDLRGKSCAFVNDNDFFGHAIGGSLGSNTEQMYDIVALTTELLTKDRPVHLLGIGKIQDIIKCVEYGIDTFDCVHPTRIARHGHALTKACNSPDGKTFINITNACFHKDSSPIEEDCQCTTCQTVSRAYLRYLTKAGELSVYNLITTHNAYFMTTLMKDIRKAIQENNLNAVQQKYLAH